MNVVDMVLVSLGVAVGLGALAVAWTVWREWRLEVAGRLLGEARADFAESIKPAQQAFQRELTIARQGCEFSISMDDESSDLVAEANRRFTMACAPSQAVFDNRMKVVDRMLARYGRRGKSPQ